MGLMIPWNDRAPARTLAWVRITPFGLPVVPEVNTSSKMSGAFGRGHAASCASQSGGNASSGSADKSSTIEVGNRSSPTSRGSGASRPLPSNRRTAPDLSTIRATVSGAMRASSGTNTSPAYMAPKYAAGSAGVDGDQVSTRSPGLSPIDFRRHAAIRLRRTTSVYVQCHVDPSSMRSPSACFGPNRAAASSSRSTMVSMVG